MCTVLSWSLTVYAALLRQVLRRLHVATANAAGRKSSRSFSLLPHLRIEVFVLQLFIEDRYALVMIVLSLTWVMTIDQRVALDKTIIR